MTIKGGGAALVDMSISGPEAKAVTMQVTGPNSASGNVDLHTDQHYYFRYDYQ